MKLLIDNQLPPALARFLVAELKVESVHVQDVGMAESSDEAIWEYACANDYVLVSKDEDFVGLFSREPCAMLLWVRIPNARKVDLLRAFASAWGTIRKRFDDGSRFIELL